MCDNLIYKQLILPVPYDGASMARCNDSFIHREQFIRDSLGKRRGITVSVFRTQ